ncbi:MAG: amidohydrolase, partial [Firmicutes bacterium]|nr:amidohydrolase [Bacillota bacterium]
ELFDRVVHIARGAAEMTETKMDYEITMAFSDYIGNPALSEMLSSCMEEFGAPVWDEADYEMARNMLRSYNEATLKSIRDSFAEEFGADRVEEILQKPLHSELNTYERVKNPVYRSGSTDVGDVAYATPTTTLNIATSCLGNVGHSWQNTSFCGSQIGMKGMLRAAEIMALACVRTAVDPALIEKAKKELYEKNGGRYTCPLPDSVLPPVGKY